MTKKLYLVHEITDEKEFDKIITSLENFLLFNEIDLELKYHKIDESIDLTAARDCHAYWIYPESHLEANDHAYVHKKTYDQLDACKKSGIPGFLITEDHGTKRGQYLSLYQMTFVENFGASTQYYGRIDTRNQDNEIINVLRLIGRELLDDCIEDNDEFYLLL